MTTFLLATLALGILGCSQQGQVQTYRQNQSGHRLIRISFRGQHGSFRIRVNAGPIEKLGNTSFTNTMTGFHLEYGDIIIWEADRNEQGKELSWPPGISTWWEHYLAEVAASFYCINSDDISDYFSSPICHWKASRDKPRPLKDASFYADGGLIGQDSAGFRAMLDAVQASGRSRAIFILAPRIKNEGQNSPWLAMEQLDAWAKEAGLGRQVEKMGWPGEIMDFARFGDPE